MRYGMSEPATASDGALLEARDVRKSYVLGKRTLDALRHRERAAWDMRERFCPPNQMSPAFGESRPPSK